MEEKKLQRLVGFMVLIAIVIILFPLLVRKDVAIEPTSPAATPIASTTEVTPATPSTQSVQPTQPVTQTQTVDQNAATNTTTTPQKSDTTQKPVSTQATNKKSSGGWSIQLGSFKQKRNAEQLIKKLETAGYTTYTSKIKTRKGAVYTKVFIGPTESLSSAKEISAKINQDWNLLGIIIPYKERS